MNLIEPSILAGAAVGGVVGAVMGFGAGPWWTVVGLLAGGVLGALAFPLLLIALGLLFILVTQGPREVLRLLRGDPG
ncbi:hypothetical protein [Corallococcus llansteffanensis]|uniref:Uncharacterized protein n=1 Tax=Corallococcus llansteffanensis TaxID=2316731 RepID=A0A3A8PUM2_9BACT|nr:hypothetical protein [Corallococcus llansteffanensis]RKH57445.1 hypothetical protein D7V93_18415 [Corallococcus llansteffanensis]